jgi:hypothetical protein
MKTYLEGDIAGLHGKASAHGLERAASPVVAENETG